MSTQDRIQELQKLIDRANELLGQGVMDYEQWMNFIKKPIEMLQAEIKLFVQEMEAGERV